MTKRASAALITSGAAALLVLALSVGSQPEPGSPRELLFSDLQPSWLANCTLKRYGEARDGGYLLCANLLGSARAGYSYGINGYDGWGCDVSRELGVVVHQYRLLQHDRADVPGRQDDVPRGVRGGPSGDG